MDKQEYQARVAWLRRYRDAVRKRKNLVLRLHEAKDAAIHISPAMSSVRYQNTDGVSATQRAVERIERAEGALLDQREVCNTLYRETLGVILKVPDTKQRRVLRLRYLAGWTMYRIAEDMHVSRQWAITIHRQAICSLDTLHLTC